jgi:hypothetical protein
MREADLTQTRIRWSKIDPSGEEMGKFVTFDKVN